MSKGLSDLTAIVAEFRIEGTVESVNPIGSGHINDSYLVTTKPTDAQDYLLQRINHGIFRDVPGLTENILKVSRHLVAKILCNSSGFDNFQVLRPIATRKGNYFFRDQKGNYWRLYNFIAGSRSFDIVETPELAFEGGKAFGIFHYLTADMDITSLIETLPDFHNIDTRLKTFRDTVNRDPEGRTGELQQEIGFVESRAEEMHTILNLGRSGAIPVRVTHNDTKFNNVLFDGQNRAVCVVDLDTVMPGYVLYDFGDAIRTGASTGAEDEQDLSQVGIDLTLFESYTRGYLSIAGKFLNPSELDHLAFSARFMTYIIGLRFLTDHIDGDHYYRIHHPGHNLQRARAQFRLVESMEERFSEMQRIVGNNT
jgi:hypothetical protein